MLRGLADEITPDRENGTGLEHEKPPDSGGQWHRIGVLTLVTFALLTCVAGLTDGPRMGDHECIVAQSPARRSRPGST